jgi:polar amino acid transport system substrate-binding protein
VLLLFVAGACSGARRTATGGLETNKDGTLTVATELPAPGFWNGDDAASVRGGFEWALAGALAKELGTSLAIRTTPFADIVAGKLDGADLALAQVSATDERRKHAQLTVPYFTSSPAVLARKGTEGDLVDLATAKGRQWVVQRATTLERYLLDVVRPDEDPFLVSTTEDVVRAVADGKADVGLLDLPTALATAKTEGLTVPARFDRPESFVGVLPKGSDNLDAIDTALRHLLADGTIDDLRAKWLEQRFARNPSDIPVIRARD